MMVFDRVKEAAREVARYSDEERRRILNAVASRILEEIPALLEANALDLAKMEKSNPLYDRLQLTEGRLEAIAEDMRSVASLPSPLGKILEARVLPNGLQLEKRSVPFGVIGIIYEARPNVTFDVFALCIKSGNACILKGGKDADNSNRAAIKLIKEVLEAQGVSSYAAELLPATHEATAELLGAVGKVDLVIPRGSRRLIDFVRDNAKVPCIETGAGVVNTYLDKDADMTIAPAIINNAKTRRVSVCNALDCLIVHEAKLPELHKVTALLLEKKVVLQADARAYAVLDGHYPFLQHADGNSFGTEFMSHTLAIRTVSSAEEAIEHIRLYGSGHSESIITENPSVAELFLNEVDAACVYLNAPTSFTDGGQFGLGAEIGISTQKLGARGPMGLSEITTYKWVIKGHGQIRQ